MQKLISSYRIYSCRSQFFFDMKWYQKIDLDLYSGEKNKQTHMTSTYIREKKTNKQTAPNIRKEMTNILNSFELSFRVK